MHARCNFELNIQIRIHNPILVVIVTLVKKSPEFCSLLRYNIDVFRQSFIEIEFVLSNQMWSFLLNLRVAHNMLASGILPNQYQRLCARAKFGKLSKTSFDRLTDSYVKGVERLTRESEKRIIT